MNSLEDSIVVLVKIEVGCFWLIFFAFSKEKGERCCVRCAYRRRFCWTPRNESTGVNDSSWITRFKMIVKKY